MTIVTRGTTYDNKKNLAPAFYSRIIKKYEGTRLGRQELNAELLTDNPGALWSHTLIDKNRVKKSDVPEDLSRIVVGVDPAVTSGEESDETGIVVAARDNQETPHFYIFDDASIAMASPNQWAQRVVDTYRAFAADRIIGEVNNGGDLVEAVIRNKMPFASYEAVRASRGKIVRAEPIAALYEQGRVHHVGSFSLLEDQMCDYDPNTSTKSPDRMDALVWALTQLSGDDVSPEPVTAGSRSMS
jgi:phage terminase large subunit-like protein